jgi:hypothetical protein
MLFLLFLAACGQDVRSLRLAEVDLSNMTVVQQLGQQLGPADRVAFTTYVAIHAASPAGTCGLRIGGRNGREPETIGEAIRVMHVRTARMERALAEARQPSIVARPANEQWARPDVGQN